MTRAALFLVVLTGCSSLFGLDRVPDVNDGSVGDGTTNDATARCLKTAYGHDICPTIIGGDTKLGGETMDTGTDPRCNAIVQDGGEPELCVIAASSFTIDSALIVTGTRPIVLWSSGTIVVTGSIDVASRSATSSVLARRGPGASIVACTPGPGAKQAAVNGGGGGGAGGSMYGRGGAGGLSDTDTMIDSLAAITPAAILGGCAGGTGGGDLGGQHGGMGGDSGGGVYLLAATSIEISGGVYAWGAGGNGGGSGNADSFAGGGGGGSGGFVGLDARTLTLTSSSVVNAQGGGGGGGASGLTAGGNGSEPTPTSGLQSAPGATSTNGAGEGGQSSGAGSEHGIAGGSYSATGGGAGGGGGGAGIIVIHATNRTFAGSISPPATLL